MAHSIGLTLYNLAARPVAEVAPPRPSRPGGSLVWLHVPGTDSLGPMLELARRLIEEDGVSVLVTHSPGLPPPALLPASAILQPAPHDFPRQAQDFLDHWRPDVALFAEGEIRPALLQEASQRRLPLLLTQAKAPHLVPGREGWFPGLMKSALSGLRLILAVDEVAARALARAGADTERIMVTGRMEEASATLPHVESDRLALAQTLATRPVWLAADVAEAEEPAVIAAHREVLKLAHRLLLILVPRNPARATALARHIEATEGWGVACRASDQEPDSETEVYIVEAAEYGLWYRLAPVTFLGGSLDGEGCARNPMEAAAMGSAMLYGPRSGQFGTAYGRLGAARAARMVGSGNDLAQALGDLLSPDRAARQAQAAWTIASEGAEVTARLMGLIRDILDGVA